MRLIRYLSSAASTVDSSGAPTILLLTSPPSRDAVRGACRWRSRSCESWSRACRARETSCRRAVKSNLHQKLRGVVITGRVYREWGEDSREAATDANVRLESGAPGSGNGLGESNATLMRTKRAFGVNVGHVDKRCHTYGTRSLRGWTCQIFASGPRRLRLMRSYRR